MMTIKPKSDVKFIRSFLVVCALLVCLLLWATSAAKASAISLRQNSIVEGQTLTLGDIFAGLPHSEDRVLGAAPMPGKDMVLNARTLMRIAIALDLDWRPASSADYVVVRRAATVIERDQLEHALRAELASQGINGLYKMLIADDMAQIVLPRDQQPSIEVSSLKLDRTQERFEATLAAPSKDNPVHTFFISGAIEHQVEIPVLRGALRHGTIIGKRDIEIITMPERHVQPDMILSENELIGKTPRRMIYAGKPVQSNDIEQPQIVGRGEVVTMIFKNGPLTLTAQGRALENGAKGDIVRVVNTASKRTIEGTVSGDKEITLTSFE